MTRQRLVLWTVRRLFGVAAGTLAALALMGAFALGAITRVMNNETRSVRESMASVHIAEELELGLWSHRRDREHQSQNAPEGRRGGAAIDAASARLHELLANASRQVATAEEERVLDDAVNRISAFIEGWPPHDGETSAADAARFAAASSAVEDYIAVNVGRADAARGRAERFDRLANAIGVVVAMALLAGVMLTLLVIDRTVYRPLVAVREAIARFRPDVDGSPAPVGGPAELAAISRTFNEMQAMLRHQRKTQLSFLAGVAHDLRNPLSVLRVTAPILVRDSAPPTTEQVRRTGVVIARQVERLDRMVGDFLDAKRIEAGAFELCKERRDIREQVRAVVELYRPMSALHQLVANLPENVIDVECDAARIEQVLGNLVSNAIKYSPEGGRVTVTAVRSANLAVVSVSDSGIGIPPAEQERIFEPFERTERSRTSAAGAGLGLFVARMIVEAHGGRLEFQSTPGAGTTFQMVLPLRPGRVVAVRPANSAALLLSR